MKNTHKIFNKLEMAEVNLLDARRYLNSGEAINWVAHKLYDAIMHAMEAWLITHGHSLDFSKGSYSIVLKFKKVAPDNLKAIAANCIASATSLGWQLEGGLDKEYEYPPFSMERWIKETYICLEKIEEFLKMITADVNKQGSAMRGNPDFKEGNT